MNINLLSYPRSGNTWLKYFLENIIANQQFDFLDFYGSTSEIQNYSSEYSLGYYFPNLDLNRTIIKRHYMSGKEADENHGDDILILILRNYKDCILSQLINHMTITVAGAINKDIKYFKENILQSISRDDILLYLNDQTQGLKDNLIEDFGMRSNVDYIGNIISYERWKGKKILIKYEDMMDDNVTCFMAISNWLVENKALSMNSISFVYDFLNDIDHHKKISINNYVETGIGLALSRESSCKDIRNMFDEDIFVKIDKIIIEKFPKIYEKYLISYGGK